jgi:hypothetical protein
MNQFTRYEVSDHLAVELARKYAEERGEPFMVMVGLHPEYDMVSAAQDVRAEIKVETTPIRTGNVAIEVFDRKYGHASGLDATAANLWIHLVLTPEGFIAVEYDVDKLKEIAKIYGKRTNCSYNSVCMLIPLEVFKKYSKRTFLFDTKFYNELTVEVRS